MTATAQPLGAKDPPRHTSVSLGLFFLLTFGLTWIVWVPRALATQGIIQSDLPGILGVGWTYAPAVAAFVFVALTAGRRGVVNLGRRLLQWRIGWSSYALIVAVPVGIAIGTAMAYGILGGEFTAALPLSFGLPLPLVPLILAIRVLTDGIGEETAWRGVALPRLLKQTNALTASLVLGLVWASWHLPLLFTKGAVMADDSIPLLFALLPAEAVFYTWLYQRTGGSVLAAALLHGLIGLVSMGSVVAEASGGPEVIRVALWWIVAGSLVVRYGRNLSRPSSRQDSRSTDPQAMTTPA